MLIDNLEKVPEMFQDGIRGIFLLLKKKDGGTGNTKRKSLKMISNNKDEWKEIIIYFMNLKLNCPFYKNHRIYASINSRNIEKAIHLFKVRSVDIDFGSISERDLFYTDIENRFFSCLMSPDCRKQSNFLIDCDSIDEYNDAKLLIPEDLVLFDYETKNGRHIITKSFNPQQYKDITIDKDNLIYIG